MSRIDESTDRPLGGADTVTDETVTDELAADEPAENRMDSKDRMDTAAARLGGDPMEDVPDGRSEPLIPADRSAEFRSRWDAVKGQFVDDPRSAVQNANTMVGEILDDLEELFRRQRSDLERGLDDEQTSTEDLRLALRRYRSFFDRLLSF